MSRSPKKSYQFGTRSLLNTSQDADYYRQRVQDLEQDKLLLQDELDQALNYQRAVPVLVPPPAEASIETFIRENSALHLENEKLGKLIRQKKTEVDLWKSKYENQMGQVIQIKANYESEIRQLSGEIQKLHARIQEFDFDKQRQILDSKAQIEHGAQSQVDHVKRATIQQQELLEAQIRKLRDHIDEQNNTIDDLQAKLLRTKTEDDHEIDRLLKENEILRHRLNELELNKQRELEELNESLNRFTLQQIDNLKRDFQHQNDVTEREVEKLKGLLEIKNVEIETLIQQNQKAKAAYEEETGQLRDEVALLKAKLLEQERQHRSQLEQLQQDLTEQNQRNIEQLRIRFEQQLDNLERELNDLKNLLLKRENELQLQMEEKAQLRAFLEQQIDEFRRELEMQKLRYHELENEKNREIQELEESYTRALSQAQEHNDQQRAQIQFLEGEVARLKEHIEQKAKELESHIQQFSLQRRGLDEEIRRLKHDVDRLRQELLNLETAKNAEIEDLKLRNHRLEISYRDKLRQLEIALEQTELDGKRLREALDVKVQELENLLLQRTALERDLRRNRDDLETYKTRLIQLEREKNVALEDLKNKLEISNQYQIEQLKAAFNTQISVLTEENASLRSTLDNRKQDIQELLEKYDQLQRAYREGGLVNAEVAASKSIYDVYLKSKRQH